MAHAFRSLGDPYVEDLLHLRAHAAVVRSLLDELDRMVPAVEARPRESTLHDLREQLAEELARLGCRLLECAATVTPIDPQLPARGLA